MKKKNEKRNHWNQENMKMDENTTNTKIWNIIEDIYILPVILKGIY